MSSLILRIKNNKDRLSFITIWTIIVVAIFLIQTSYEKKNTIKLAEIEAISTYRSDLNFRSWISYHGGVYIPITEETKPNPYLKFVQEQNITTSLGKSYTLMNPAWAIRSLNNFDESTEKAKSKITSLNPIRPENAPDEWESMSLQAFEEGSEHMSGFDTVDNEIYYRYMKPLITKSSCLNCHEHQGYKLGDIRGGISVSIPYAPYLEIEKGVILEHGLVLSIIYIAVSFVILKYVNIIRIRNSIIEEARQSLLIEIEHSNSINQKLENEIVRQKIAEREKEKMLVQLNRMNKLEGLGELAGGIAHDFNNILQGISSSSQLLLRHHKKLDDKAKKYAEMIYQASLRGAHLTSKLLSYSKDNNSIFKELNLHQIIDEVVDFLSSSIEKKIEIQAEKKADNFHITGDENAIKNALTNLIINSSHAISSNGTIIVRSKNISFDKVNQDSFLFEIPPGDYCTIEVHDTGSGIPPKLMDKVFDPFFTTKPKGFGTGLGLALVYNTVQKHKGSIDVSSSPNAGTSISMTFPCINQSFESEKREEIIVMGGGKILLVDDEEVNRITGRDILESLGYEVLIAEDGEEAAAIYERNYPEINLIMLDMIMPKMDGKETFTLLKQINRDCKVIIASGYAKSEMIKQLMDEGALGFIKKPFSISELSKIIKDLVYY